MFGRSYTIFNSTSTDYNIYYRSKLLIRSVSDYSGFFFSRNFYSTYSNGYDEKYILDLIVQSQKYHLQDTGCSYTYICKLNGSSVHINIFLTMFSCFQFVEKICYDDDNQKIKPII